MSGMTNPDNGMMENQQAADLGHAVDGGDTPKIRGASIESPIPRLAEGVDADGLLEGREDMPDRESEEARRHALAQAQAQAKPRR